jgi:hypothetical protein
VFNSVYFNYKIPEVYWYAVPIKNFFFWNATPCNLVHTYQFFGGSWLSQNDGNKQFCSVLNYWNSLRYSLLHYNSSFAIGTFSHLMHSLLLWQVKLMIIANRFTVNSTHNAMPERETRLGGKCSRVSNRVLQFGCKLYPVFVRKGGPVLCLVTIVQRSPVYRNIKPSGHTDAYFVQIINLTAGILRNTPVATASVLYQLLLCR